MYNAPARPPHVPGFTHLQAIPQKREFSIRQRPDFAASFTESGLLKALRVGNTTVPVHLEFVKYGTKAYGDRSGAYLFLPDKPEPDPIPVPHNTVIHVIEGPLLSRVYLQLPHLFHTCTLFNSPGSDGLGLQIFNEVDISETNNFELAMRLNTDIASGDQFFTDINGLNVIIYYYQSHDRIEYAKYIERSNFIFTLRNKCNKFYYSLKRDELSLRNVECIDMCRS